MTLLQELEKSSYKYSPTVVKDLIRSNRKSFGFVKPETKKVIYFMMKRVIIRGVHKFFVMQKNRGNDTYLSEGDITNELYIILDSCVNKFDTESGKDFYLYYNKAVNNRVDRIANYKRNIEPNISFSSITVKDNEGMDYNPLLESGAHTSKQHLSMDMVLEEIMKIDLTEMEREVLVMLSETNKVNDIRDELGISLHEYKLSVESLKVKISNSKNLEIKQINIEIDE